MEKMMKKCSIVDHKEIDAINYCQECKIYMCNKCDKFHSALFKVHHLISLEKNINDTSFSVAPSCSVYLLA